MKRIILAAVAALCFVAPSAGAQNACSFDYVADGGLLQTTFTEIPAEKLKDSDLMSTMRQMLPNVRRIFDADRRYMALIGWTELPEDYSKYSDMQVERTLVQGAELAKRQGKVPAEGYKYETDFGPPITATYTMDYNGGTKLYRDVAMDVIATKNCLFSIKISGARMAGDEATWAQFAQEFKRVAEVIGAHEGPVPYSKEGRASSTSGVIYLTYVALGVLIAAGLGFVLRRKYQIEPGKASRNYSIAVVLLCTIMLGILALLMSGGTLREDLLSRLNYGSITEAYVGFTPIFIVLVVHLVALFRRTPLTILVAISLMIGLLTARVLYMAVGWLALPHANELVGLGVSVALLAYATSGTFKKPIVSADGNVD